MTTDELRAVCKTATENYKASLNWVVLILPMQRGGNKVRLAGKGSPYGQVLAPARDRRCIARFDARQVLAWLDYADGEKKTGEVSAG